MPPTPLPMPIRTPRLLIRPRQAGDGAGSAAAVAETWEQLHRWMSWASHLADNTPEQIETRSREVMAGFLRGGSFDMLGLDIETGQPVVWCGLHDFDWQAHHCETGFWVRKSAQGRGFATEAANAMLRYAFAVLGMQRVSLTHSAGNERSRRIAQKLGFTPQAVLRDSNILPGGRFADRHCYARFDTAGLPPLDVRWGIP